MSFQPTSASIAAVVLDDRPLGQDFCMEIQSMSSGKWRVCLLKPEHKAKHRFTNLSETEDEALRRRAGEIRRRIRRRDISGLQ